MTRMLIAIFEGDEGRGIVQLSRLIGLARLQNASVRVAYFRRIPRDRTDRYDRIVTFAAADGIGVNFAIFSENAHKIELCLYDHPNDATECERIELPERTAHVFHGYVPNMKPGQLYGYRVHGPHDPANGLRFNPARVLVDPYAYAIANAIGVRIRDLPLTPERVLRALRDREAQTNY